MQVDPGLESPISGSLREDFVTASQAILERPGTSPSVLGEIGEVVQFLPAISGVTRVCNHALRGFLCLGGVSLVPSTRSRGPLWGVR
jgi:hypothetical protein